MGISINKEKLVVANEKESIEYDVLFTFECETTKKSYIGYTDNTIAANGRKTIYVSSYDPTKENIELEDINDPKELNMIQDVLSQIDSEAADN